MSEDSSDEEKPKKRPITKRARTMQGIPAIGPDGKPAPELVKGPLTRRGQTLQGLPAVESRSAVPESDPPGPPGSANPDMESAGSGGDPVSSLPPPGDSSLDDLYPRSRITMDFSGPPLALPEESGTFGLELDTSELAGLEAASTNPARPPDEPLDLDMMGFDGGDSNDGWGRDRRRRSTPPPSGAVARAVMDEFEPGDLELIDESEITSPGVIPSLGDGDALDLVDHSRASQPEVNLPAEMAERYALGDFTGSLSIAELLLGQNAEHGEAKGYAKSCRERLEQFYSSRLGALDQKVEVMVPDADIRWLGLDHRAGFLLSRIDGDHSVEETIDVSGMPRLEALKTLAELLDAAAIRLI